MDIIQRAVMRVLGEIEINDAVTSWWAPKIATAALPELTILGDIPPNDDEELVKKRLAVAREITHRNLVNQMPVIIGDSPPTPEN